MEYFIPFFSERTLLRYCTSYKSFVCKKESGLCKPPTIKHSRPLKKPFLRALKKTKEERRARRAMRTCLPSREMAGVCFCIQKQELRCSLAGKTQGCNASCLLPLIISNKKSSHRLITPGTLSVLLFITGLRISNLLMLTAGHIHQLLNEQRFDLALIKKKKTIVQTVIPAAAYPLFEDFKAFFFALIQNKKHDDLVITPEKSTKPIRRESLNKRINDMRRNDASSAVHKNIKSHSFCIN